jgi:hypothetical protein
MPQLLRWVPLLTAGATIAACGGSSPGGDTVATTSYRGLPSDAPSAVAHAGGTWAVWHGATLELALEGSSSCPTRPVGVTVTGPAGIEVDTSAKRSPNQGCTADLGPTTWVLDVPPTVRDGDVLTVAVTGGSTLTVHRS